MLVRVTKMTKREKVVVMLMECLILMLLKIIRLSEEPRPWQEETRAINV